MGRQDHEGTLDEWGEGLSPALSCPVTGLCITSSPPLSALPSALGLRLSCAKPGPTHSRMGAERIEEPREDDASRRQWTAEGKRENAGTCCQPRMHPDGTSPRGPAIACVVVRSLGSPFGPDGVRTGGRRTTRLATSVRHPHFHSALASRHH